MRYIYEMHKGIHKINNMEREESVEMTMDGIQRSSREECMIPVVGS
jgi:hypothetical protein